MSSIRLAPSAPIRSTASRTAASTLVLLLLVAAMAAGWTGVVLVLAGLGAAASTWLALYTASGIGA